MIPSGGALVTGASRGIGRAVALELARRGFTVVATMRDVTDGASLADELEATVPGSITVQRLDVVDPESMVMPDDLRVLVNNAGVDGENLPLEHTPVDEWRRLFETNVFGLVEVTRRAVPVLRANGGGVIVNVTSSSLVVPMPFYSAYRASKAAVSALSESLRAEVAAFGIDVVEVLPGPVDTDMLTRSRLPEAAGFDPYAPLAEHITGLRENEPTASTADAARTIAHAVCAAAPPHRTSCDPMGAELLDGWAATPDATWQRTFLGAFDIS
jgi:NAD(P)-dependent dehydrogenase (short-subunit alcohol dehydrogenase family)